MNTRVLNIIENPELLQIEDLKLLENEIENIPYAQSLRAIYLLGINKFRNENFQQELTKTAAYTTDKKILYQIINRNNQPKFIPNIVENIPTDIATEKNILENSEEIKHPTEAKINTITEEKLTEQNTASGIDFYQKNTPDTHKKEEEETPHHTTKNSMIDFYSTPIKREFYAQSVSSPINFYERQIQSIEDTQKEEKVEEIEPLEENIVIENPSENISLSNDNQQKEAQDYQWKPMEIENIAPISAPKTEIIEEIEEEIITETEKEENNISVEMKESLIEEEDIIPQKTSNVSQFINTWQNWLKATPPPPNREKNIAIIDKFIENNPKISPISEDAEFNFKEKDDDISHLMTETLAQLYLEQKLYSKAINAYEILIEKYPERSEDFSKAIEEIKKMRNK